MAIFLSRLRNEEHRWNTEKILDDTIKRGKGCACLGCCIIITFCSLKLFSFSNVHAAAKIVLSTLNDFDKIITLDFVTFHLIKLSEN